MDGSQWERRLVFGGSLQNGAENVVGPVIWGGTPAVIAWMRSRGLLASNATCICGHAMRERRRSDISDGISWYCPSCKKTKTIRKDSFFAKSKMTLQEWLILINFTGGQGNIHQKMHPKRQRWTKTQHVMYIDG